MEAWMRYLKSIIKQLNKNKALVKALKKIVNVYRKLIYNLIFIHLKLNEKTVIFCSHLGRNYSDNPKAIYEYMLKDERFKDYQFIWAFKNTDKYNINKGLKVKYASLKYLFYLSKSRYWIFNAKMPGYIIKKKDQLYLQTWHGTPLKRLGRDIDVGEAATFYRSGMSKTEMVKTYLKDSSRYDYFVSANEFSTKAFMSAFDIKEDIIIETGYPRNDILVNATDEYINNIKGKMKIPHNKTVILYAPTWRDDKYDTTGYLHELKVDFNKWHKALGDKYFIIYKPHYLIYNTENLYINADFVYDASQYEEINDLYLVSNMLITDYSSVFFDYGILNRPVLFYMYDLDQYKNNLRGFYLDIYKDLPGPIIENEEELLSSIINIDAVEAKFKNRYSEFYNRFCILNDGRSSEKVINKLMY
jgi:CDP-glycerol glycerophosphotransferase